MGGPTNKPQQTVTANTGSVDLLDTGIDLLGGGVGGFSSNTTTDLLGGGSNDLLGFSSSGQSSTQYSLDGMMEGFGSMMNTKAPKIQLSPTSELDSERFQQLWMQLPVGCGGQPLMKSLRLDI